jgi:pimeloyl-ACP methyl ester carboxylesterase
MSHDRTDPAASPHDPARVGPAPDGPGPLLHLPVGSASIGCRVAGPLSPGSVPAAPPLLLLMGSSGTMEMWPDALVAALALDRTVILFDHRGMGTSTAPAGPYPFETLADDAAALVRALGHDRADLLGWSMGGSVALDMAVRHPEVVGRVVSYAGGPGGAEAIPPTPEALATLTDASMPPRERGMALLALLFPPAWRAAHPDYARSVPIPRTPVLPEAIKLQNAAIGTWAGTWDGLGRMAAPTLFVTGDEDVIAPAENAVRMAARAPWSVLVRFPGAGHGLMYQLPEVLAATILLFLAEATTPA